jgi:hypothetical protein
MKINKIGKIISCSLLLGSLNACSTIWSSAPESRTVVVEKYGSSLDAEPVPGTVVGPWAETMYQDVDVPGSIRGVVYRMPHRTIYEVRPEKYQRAQYPDQDGLYRERE